MRKLSIIALLLFSTLAMAQRGTIRGSVFDDGTGESLVGVSILIKGTLRGCITDLDGKFSLDIEPGTYDLQISYISYQTITIEDLQVKAGEVKLLNDMRLKESSLELGEVVVKAEMVRTTEAAVNTLKMKSAVIMDGISSARMQLTGDGTAVEAAKRVTGVSIEGGKYVYVRGLGDRYSKTTLNQVDIPGLDPDKNSLQMDIFPTNLIDNIMVHKSFTADMPADFTGGIMNVETKDFPDKRMMSVSFSAGFNPDMHLNSDFLGYEGGATDFLGFDDGTRALPEGADQSSIPTPISGAGKQEVSDFIRSFSNTLEARREKSLVDYSLGFSYGDQKKLKNRAEGEKGASLGYIVSLSYKSDYKYYSQVENSEYQRSIDPGTYAMRYATLQQGEIGEHNVLGGLLAGVAYKNQYTKLRLTALLLQNGESRAARFTILNDGEAVGQSGYSAFSHNLEYNQRSLRNILLQGTHLLNEGQWEIDWRISPTFSVSDDPDIRKTAFTQTSSGTYAFS
ncbi:MAG TPA: carboxypeptidase-like regulatory domain-containing protein, partial [Bacteroidales bacterium]|nr:carboxypeptidase-like regulatory domain-containing protein [Bacteroidales bacterium]